jgi:hypothetical protein
MLMRAMALLSVTLLVNSAATAQSGASRGHNELLPIERAPWLQEGPQDQHQLAQLWGDRGSGQAGVLLRTPGGFKSGIHAHTADYRALVIAGTWIHTVPEAGESNGVELRPGSYWTQRRDQMHADECKPGAECIVFVFTEAKYETYQPKE